MAASDAKEPTEGGDSVSTAQPTAQQPTPNINDIFRTVADKLGADIYVYSGDMNRTVASNFIDMVEQVKSRRQKALLILCTYGGDADAAYIIARHLRRMYKGFTLCVFGPCKSAGTLLAL